LFFSPTTTGTSGLIPESSTLGEHHWAYLDRIDQQLVSQVERMRSFPQEFIDKVIDELAGVDRDRVAPYSCPIISLISQQIPD